MKEKLKIIGIKAYFNLLMLYKKWVLKCRNKHVHALFCSIYIHTFSLFPDKKLSYNENLSLKASLILCDYEANRNAFDDVDKSDIEKLLNTVKEDVKIKSILFNYYRLTSFYFSYEFYSKSDQVELILDNSLSKAKLYSDEVQEITEPAEVGLIYKKIKKTIKVLSKDARKLASERLEREKYEAIEPIEITSSHILFIASLFTTLFLVSGFIYTKFLYGSFGLRVGDFFTTSDYLSSSVDVLVSVCVSTAAGIIGMFWGFNSSIEDEVRVKHYNSYNKKNDYAFSILVLFCTFNLIFHSYKTGELLKIYLLPLLFIIGIFCIFKLPVLKYVKNRGQVSAILFSILIFLLHLSFTVKEDINKIKSGSFISPYYVVFNAPYEKYKSHVFIGSNSNFIFLYSKEKRYISVVPRSGVRVIKTKKN